MTGSSSGIGRAIAEVLAAEGVRVVVHGRNGERTRDTAHAIRESGGTADVALGDLATEEGAQEVIRAVEHAVGGVDILVNNIGGNEAASRGLSGWFNDTPDVWMGVMQQNLIAPVRMIHAFVPAMRERGWAASLTYPAEAVVSRRPKPQPTVEQRQR